MHYNAAFSFAKKFADIDFRLVSDLKIHEGILSFAISASLTWQNGGDKLNISFRVYLQAVHLHFPCIKTGIVCLTFELIK